MKLATLRRLCVPAVLAIVAACSTTTANLSPIGSDGMTPYRLGAGDEVRITVFGLDAITNNYSIGDTGKISLPLLGNITAEGQTVEELEATIVEALRAKEVVRAPSVSAQVQKYRPFFILGEVQRPGQYTYVPGMSVLTAVSIAGGYTFRAEKDRAVITRSGANKIRQGAARPDTPIMPGDTVLVTESWF